MNFLELSNLKIKYPKSKDVILENINLTFKKGEMVAIIGHSGVGKSTLFKTIVKNLKPIQGEVKFNNQNIWNLNKKNWKNIMNQLGFLTQKPNLLLTDDVYTNIKRSIVQYKNYFFKILGYLTKEQKINIFQTLDSLNILDKAFYRISELSGGQQQRVEITKLLIKKVNLILADEPTANLDNKSAKEVLTILKNLKNEKKITILVNIHDLSLIKNYFDRVIVIKNKTIALDSTIENIDQKDLEQIINAKN
ncbi:phosphonate ABC transporter ATP-binding protein [Mycoplasmopsis columbina]|uniref:ABC transporter ATP-binding protein n=1 Tax=Mycoplasmopsis columbina SF7 TaxID=1037410 RepID=F9UJ95_9BACT|nr:ATP-binding cassette domain-containing protein [Mycoplasmopsis columbina]EGV00538.1 ABC transporter ATP-binding protein [Mycoplasmopsis columbina SF7]VEU76891.1 ABC transporter ATP-binding protein [Mycoplasmopsis columbina]